MMLHLIGEDTAVNDRRSRQVEAMRRKMAGLDNVFRVMAIDLAQSVDYSFITILERSGDMNLIRHLERLPPGMSYPDQVDRFVMLTKYSHIDRVIIDRTGIGMAIHDLLKKAGIKSIGLTLTGGNEPTFKGSLWSVPKRDVVAALLIAFQNGFIKIANLPERKTLLEELQNFEIKISQSGHDTYQAAGTGHDDGVISAGLAIYCANRLYHKSNLNMDDAKGFGSLTPVPEELSLSEIHRRAMNDYHRLHR